MRMEETWIRMSKRLIAFAAVTFMLLAVLCGAACAEEIPATPSDLEPVPEPAPAPVCAHEHTKTTIYFYDSPAYAPVDAESHRVFGPASVETVCEDCGETLSVTDVDSAEEIRPHRIKKGVCALCGYTEPVPAEEPQPAGRSGEETVVAREDSDTAGMEGTTLSAAELAKLNREGVSTVLVHGKKGTAAVVVNVKDALAQTEAAGADLSLEIAERDDGSVFVGMYLVSASGKRVRAARGGAVVRIYRKNRDDVRVSVAPSDRDALQESEGTWNDQGYWSVPYTTDGTYFLLQQ